MLPSTRSLPSTSSLPSAVDGLGSDDAIFPAGAHGDIMCICNIYVDAPQVPTPTSSASYDQQD